MHLWVRGTSCKPNIYVSWSTSEFRVRLVHRFTGISHPVKLYWPMQGGAFLWIIYVISVLFCYALMYVCLLMPCGHLLGKVWPLGSRLWCLFVTLSLPHWYPGSGVVLDFSDSLSLPYFFSFIRNNAMLDSVCFERSALLDQFSHSFLIRTQ